MVSHQVWTWVGLTDILGVQPAVRRNCSYLLPRQNGGTPHIKVNPNQCPDLMTNPILMQTITI